MSKYTQNQVEKINKLAVVEIPALITAGCNEQAYNMKRAELNMEIVKLCVGGEIVDLKGKNEGKMNIKFNKPLPSKAEVGKVAQILDTFVKKVELPFFAELNAEEGMEDMEIPHTPVAALEKATNKELKARILGDGYLAYYKQNIGPMDVYTIAAIGEEARKRANRTKLIVIGGVVLAVTAATVAGVYIYNKKKEENELLEVADDDHLEDDVDSDNIDPDEEDIDIDAVEVPLDE